jgi:hypothetical protein
MDKFQGSTMMTVSMLSLPSRSLTEKVIESPVSPTDPAQTEYPFLYSLVLSFIWKVDPIPEKSGPVKSI